MRTIPFNKPCLAGRELDYLAEAVANGHISASGPFTSKVRDILKSRLGVADAILTTSCTDALEMAAMLLKLGPGDSVVLPSFTFSSTATAFARQGAKLKFCDIRQPSLGMDPKLVRNLIDDSVKAIVTVHYAGVTDNIDELVEIASEHQIPLIEDNAHGLFASHHGKDLGTFGDLSTLSFHETKNFHCGEGGALLINNASFIEEAHILLNKGTNRKQFLDGITDKYTWHGVGSSFGLSDLLAGFLLGQLENADLILESRKKAHEAYLDLLEEYDAELGLELPFQPPGDAMAYHMFYVLLPPQIDRTQVISEMKKDGVNPTFHYVPLHSAPAATEYAWATDALPVTDYVSSRLLRLPFFNDITKSMQTKVVASLVRAIRMQI